MRDLSVPWLFLLASVVGAAFTLNALRPMGSRPRRSVVSFFAGWLTTELALHHLAWQALMTVVFVWFGALGAWPGVVGLAITLASWAGLVGLYRTAQGAEEIVERALVDTLGESYRDTILPGIAEKFAPAVDYRQLVMPFPMRHPEVERTKNIVYTRIGKVALKLDVYRRRDRPAKCPTLVQIHGGAWILGSKNEQGVPLMLHLASRGWVCISVDYRLSPRATFPDHLVDLKRALQWVREQGPEYGVDPDFVVVTGGSAGGHLATLVALTQNAPEYQPGFEQADTSVQGCVAFYGVYDFTDRHGVYRHQGLRRLLERRVMKCTLADARHKYEKASPMSCIEDGIPPFFVVHGTNDTLVPVEEARHFTQALRAVEGGPVVYAEMPGAQHAFEIFPSLRALFVVHGVERFLAWTYSRHVQALATGVERRAVAD